MIRQVATAMPSAVDIIYHPNGNATNPAANISITHKAIYKETLLDGAEPQYAVALAGEVL